MVTGTVVVLDSPPLVPVTDTLNGATPVAHVTESTAPVKLAVQPTGTVPAEKVTVPENPLIGVTVTVEVPATVASVVIAGAESAKSWTVTGTLTVLTTPLVALVPVTDTRSRSKSQSNGARESVNVVHSDSGRTRHTRNNTQ